MTEHSPASVLSGHDELPGLPSRAMSPAQQLEALRKVQAQAEQRVKLGVQLFRAAEARVASQQRIIDEIKSEQAKLREQVQDDVGRSLHAYDQWVGQIDESFTEALQALEARIDGLAANWTRSEARFEQMLAKSEAMLEETRQLVRRVTERAGTASEASAPVPNPAPPRAPASRPEPARAESVSPSAAPAAAAPANGAPVPRSAEPASDPTPAPGPEPVAERRPADQDPVPSPRPEAAAPPSGEEIFSRVIDRLRARDGAPDQGDKAA